MFFPPYGIAFVVFSCFIYSGALFSNASPILWATAVLAIAVPPAAILSLQAVASMRKHLMSAHAAFLLANGVPPFRLRRLLMANVGVELTPSIEKLVTGALTTLLFTELVFGLSGLGTLAVRAVRRSDLELLAAVVFTFAVLICAARVAAALVRMPYVERS